jgi:hypothetical protein
MINNLVEWTVFGRGNRSTRRKAAPKLLCPPQILLARPGREPGPPQWLTASANKSAAKSIHRYYTQITTHTRSFMEIVVISYWNLISIVEVFPLPHKKTYFIFLAMPTKGPYLFTDMWGTNSRIPNMDNMHLTHQALARPTYLQTNNGYSGKQLFNIQEAESM